MTDHPLIPIVIPEFPGSHPFSRGQNPKHYTPDELRDRGTGETARTDFFKKYLVAIYWALADAVPYAFCTADGTVRSLDAGCLKFLLNRNPSDVALNCGSNGKIVSVTPRETLLSLYQPIRDKLINEVLVNSSSAGLSAPSLDLSNIAPEFQDLFDPDFVVDERRKAESERIIREGASQFRKSVIDAWSGRCAITGTDIALVLDAAHIYPYLGPRTNDVRNGIALRTDIHRLFDRGMLTIRIEDGIARIEIHGKLADGFYGSLAGAELALPTGKCCPDIRLLDRHRRLSEAKVAGFD